MTSCPGILSFLVICPANSAVLSTLSRKFYHYKPHPMYCKRKMYDLLQRRCMRGCGFVGVASSPGTISGEVGNYVTSI